MCLEESRKMCLETSRELRAAMADDREWDRSLHRAQMDSFQAHVDARQSRQEAELKELKDNVALIKKFWEDTTRVPTPVDPRPTAEGAPTVKKKRRLPQHESETTFKHRRSKQVCLARKAW